jgi:hypothetical protein
MAHSTFLSKRNFSCKIERSSAVPTVHSFP